MSPTRATLTQPEQQESLSPSIMLPTSPHSSEESPHHIPVIVGHAPDPQVQQSPSQPRTSTLKTVRRSNRAVAALSLPNIMVANHRSIFPKFNNLVDELLENDMQLGLHSEVWEDSDNNAHANIVEEALEIHGIQYIPRKC